MRALRRFFLALVLLSFPLAGTAQASNQNVLAGAGDYSAGAKYGGQTLQLLQWVNPGTVFTLGDYGYDSPPVNAWHILDSKTKPTRGNHESAGTYTGEYGQPLWYSYDVAGAHFVVLDGNSPTNSAQLQWLKADLATSKAKCKVAYWHQPAYSSGKHPAHGSALWTTAATGGVTLVMNGHEHSYSRFAPRNGVTEIIVGTGHTKEGWSQSAGGVKNITNTAGVLKLTVHPTSLDFAFIELSHKVGDSGTIACR